MPVCPEEAPTEGEACSPDGAPRACTYGDCDGEPTITATCTDGQPAIDATCTDGTWLVEPVAPVVE